jgi:hypothetical protein
MCLRLVSSKVLCRCFALVVVVFASVVVEGMVVGSEVVSVAVTAVVVVLVVVRWCWLLRVCVVLW